MPSKVASAAGGVDSPSVGGVRISHPDRMIYPELGVSKIQFARYFERIGEWILPHVVGRPLTLGHCPNGLAAPCNYLKHAKAWGPNALRRVRIQETTKVGEYLVADSVAATRLTRDPWKRYWTSAQEISDASLAAVKRASHGIS